MSRATDKDSRITGWKPLLHALGANVESAIDHVRHRFNRRFRPDRRLHVLAYRGFGNRERCTLSGRVLIYREQPDAAPDALWTSLQASYRRFETDEVPGIRVQARASSSTETGDKKDSPMLAEAVTDDEGYFLFDFETPDGIDGPVLTLDLSLPDQHDAVVDGAAEVMLAGANARFGVISDIDDTVLITQATSLLKMMRLTLLESSESRVAFPGVAAFYEALNRGGNPFFYVSSSPWNLHEFLSDFMRLKGIVAGPMLLRDFGLDRDKLVAGPHLAHKLTQIRSVLDRHPDLHFLLIGDSGQHDPEVYRDIVNEYPDRILAIYIRDVSGDARDRTVAGIANELAAAGVDMLLVPDTLAAARHAATRGWLDEAALERVAVSVDSEHERHPAMDDQLA